MEVAVRAIGHKFLTFIKIFNMLLNVSIALRTVDWELDEPM
jgi:hypothetical protein